MKKLLLLTIILLTTVSVTSCNCSASSIIELGAVSLANGDIDGDNMVTSYDLGIVLLNLDSKNCSGDLDGDFEVTTTDLSILLKNLYLGGDF